MVNVSTNYVSFTVPLRSKELVAMIENYIYYYNNERYQRRFGVMTPMEKYESYFLAA